MVRIAICDDDTGFCQQMKGYIEQLDLTERVDIKTFSDGDLLLTEYEKLAQPFDMVLLDIEMPLLDGVSAAAEIRGYDRNVVIVIITAFPRYALPASRHQPFYYLLKPLEQAQFTEDFMTAYRTCVKRREQAFRVETKTRYVFLPYADIIFVEGQGTMSTVYTANQSKYSFWRPLSQVAKELEQEGFFQIHKSFLVSLDKVREYDRVSRMVLTVDGYQLPVSKRRATPFRKSFLQQDLQ